MRALYLYLEIQCRYKVHFDFGVCPKNKWDISLKINFDYFKIKVLYFLNSEVIAVFRNHYQIAGRSP